MTAFEVSLNGGKLCVAGIEGPGTVSLILSWIHGEKDTPREGGRMELNVGGINGTTKEFATWIDSPGTGFPELAQGDEIHIRVVESQEVTLPTFRPLDTLQQTRELKERYLQELAEELGWTVTPPADPT